MPLRIHPIFSFEFFSRPRQLLPLFIKKWRHSFIDPFNYHAFIKYLTERSAQFTSQREGIFFEPVIFLYFCPTRFFRFPQTSRYPHNPRWSSESMVAWFLFQNGTKVDGHIKGFQRKYDYSSVQFSRSVASNSLRPHESQQARPSCPSPTPGVYSYSCPLTTADC